MSTRFAETTETQGGIITPRPRKGAVLAPEGQPFNVCVQVLDTVEEPVPDLLLRRTAKCVLAMEGVRQRDSDRGSPLGVVIADDDTVRDLNRRQRGLDEATDVLSFSFRYEEGYRGQKAPPSASSDGTDFILPPGAYASLGEVIISYPQAVRQAVERGHTVERELALLLAHGVLHLLGYDHVKRNEAAAMQAKEATVLAQVMEDE